MSIKDLFTYPERISMTPPEQMARFHAITLQLRVEAPPNKVASCRMSLTGDCGCAYSAIFPAVGPKAGLLYDSQLERLCFVAGCMEMRHGRPFLTGAAVSTDGLAALPNGTEKPVLTTIAVCRRPDGEFELGLALQFYDFVDGAIVYEDVSFNTDCPSLPLEVVEQMFNGMLVSVNHLFERTG